VFLVREVNYCFLGPRIYRLRDSAEDRSVTLKATVLKLLQQRRVLTLNPSCLGRVQRNSPMRRTSPRGPAWICHGTSPGSASLHDGPLLRDDKTVLFSEESAVSGKSSLQGSPGSDDSFQAVA